MAPTASPPGDAAGTEKENWEMVVYPLENHGFVEPSSWTDEYQRILKLFEETLK